MTDSTDLANFVALRNPGEKISIGIVRGHTRKTVTATLAPRPASATR